MSTLGPFPMKKLLFAGLVSASLAAGCGNVIVEGSGGGGAGGTTGSGGATTTSSTSSTTTVPSDCAVPAGPGPHATVFRFTNPADGPGDTVYLRQLCDIVYEVRGCDGGYGDPLVLAGQCTVDCAQSNECIACEPCPDEGVPLQPGESYDVKWPGYFYTFEQNAVGCQCHVQHVAPAQLYQLSIPVFASPDDVPQDLEAYSTVLFFELPAAGDLVDVMLYPSPQ